MGHGLWCDRNGVPAQAPAGAAADSRGPGLVGRSQGGCPTAGDTPLPILHNGENQIMDLLCRSPFSDLSARRRWLLAAPPGDSLRAVTLHREAECPV